YETKPTHLGEFLRKSSDLFGRTRKEVSINYAYQDGLWIVDVDRPQMEQILLNLYMNAWQAMPEGGEILVDLHNVVLDDQAAAHRGMKPGRYVRLTVTDTGVGMDEKTRERIFEPFFTTKDRSRGTGLGLASVYGIVRNHGGFIEVLSQPGQGTSFMIYLPASDSEPVTETPSTQSIRTGRETVLLIDDEDMIRDVGSRMLGSLGYRVITASGGKEGLRLFEEHRGEVSLVILDMIMPEIGGKETFSLLRRMDPKVKVLLASGYSLDSHAQEILDRGCNGFIQKPFTLEDLSLKVRELLEDGAG
ncbi:MAG TPA: response regulator, partial [Deltaproteobacteria bacterium]|nr:response regulator [Deltaproteobacteria bacterium]